MKIARRGKKESYGEEGRRQREGRGVNSTKYVAMILYDNIMPCNILYSPLTSLKQFVKITRSASLLGGCLLEAMGPPQGPVSQKGLVRSMPGAPHRMRTRP